MERKLNNTNTVQEKYGKELKLIYLILYILHIYVDERKYAYIYIWSELLSIKYIYIYACIVYDGGVPFYNKFNFTNNKNNNLEEKGENYT